MAEPLPLPAPAHSLVPESEAVALPSPASAPQKSTFVGYRELIAPDRLQISETVPLTVRIKDALGRPMDPRLFKLEQRVPQASR